MFKMHNDTQAQKREQFEESGEKAKINPIKIQNDKEGSFCRCVNKI